MHAGQIVVLLTERHKSFCVSASKTAERREGRQHQGIRLEEGKLYFLLEGVRDDHDREVFEC